MVYCYIEWSYGVKRILVTPLTRASNNVPKKCAGKKARDASGPSQCRPVNYITHWPFFKCGRKKMALVRYTPCRKVNLGHRKKCNAENFGIWVVVGLSFWLFEVFIAFLLLSIIYIFCIEHDTHLVKIQKKKIRIQIKMTSWFIYGKSRFVLWNVDV